MLLLLSVLILFGTVAENEACPSVTLTLSEKESSCTGHALFLNPSHFEQRNKSCIFHRVCSKTLKVDTKNGTYKLIQETIQRVEIEQAITWKCPVYQKIPADEEVLLLRTHAATKISPYWLLKRGKTNDYHMTLDEADNNSSKVFKSPLFNSGAYRRTLKEVRLVLLNENAAPVASLGFQFRRTDVLGTGFKWFSRTRLVSASPWSYKRMRRLRYNYFSFDGVKDSRVTRRFYINLRFGGCPNDAGFLGVMERVYCSFEKGTKYLPAYLWTHSKSNEGRWSRKTNEAAEFRLYGIFRNSTELFVRKSEEC